VVTLVPVRAGAVPPFGLPQALPPERRDVATDQLLTAGGRQRRAPSPHYMHSRRACGGVRHQGARSDHGSRGRTTSRFPTRQRQRWGGGEQVISARRLDRGSATRHRHVGRWFTHAGEALTVVHPWFGSTRVSDLHHALSSTNRLACTGTHHSGPTRRLVAYSSHTDRHA
jgi:hypothetical protein